MFIYNWGFAHPKKPWQAPPPDKGNEPVPSPKQKACLRAFLKLKLLVLTPRLFS